MAFITSPNGFAAMLFPIPEFKNSVNIDPIPRLSAFSAFCFINLKYSAKFIAPVDVNISDTFTLDDIDLVFGVNIAF